MIKRNKKLRKINSSILSVVAPDQMSGVSSPLAPPLIRYSHDGVSPGSAADLQHTLSSGQTSQRFTGVTLTASSAQEEVHVIDHLLRLLQIIQYSNIPVVSLQGNMIDSSTLYFVLRNTGGILLPRVK